MSIFYFEQIPIKIVIFKTSIFARIKVDKL